MFVAMHTEERLEALLLSELLRVVEGEGETERERERDRKKPWCLKVGNYKVGIYRVPPRYTGSLARGSTRLHIWSLTDGSYRTELH